MSNENEKWLPFVRNVGQRFVVPAAGIPLPKRAYRVRDLMYMLGLPKSTIHDFIKRGDLRAVKIGNGRRKILLIPAEEIERLLALPSSD